MSGKRILGACGIVLATFVGAGTLAKWANDEQTTSNKGMQAGDIAQDVTKKSAEKLAKFARDAGSNLGKTTITALTSVVDGTKTVLEPVTNALNVSDAVEGATASVVKTAASDVSKVVAEPARFVELKLNRNAPQVLSGRAPKGATVTILKDGTQIGQVKTSKSGIWTLAVDPPITEPEYALTLQSSTDGNNVIAGQTAVVALDETGRARITLKPAPNPADVAKKATDNPATATTDTNASKTAQANTETKSPSQSDETDSTSSNKADSENAKTTTASDTNTFTTEAPAASIVEKPDTTKKTTAEAGEKTKAPAKVADSDTAEPEVAAATEVTKPTDLASDTTVQTTQTEADEENNQGILDGILDQASKMAEAATEKFSDVLSSSTTSDETAPQATTDETKVASTKPSAEQGGDENTVAKEDDDTATKNQSTTAVQTTEPDAPTTTPNHDTPGKQANAEDAASDEDTRLTQQPEASDRVEPVSPAKTDATPAKTTKPRIKTKRSIRKSRTARRKQARKTRAARRRAKVRAKRRALSSANAPGKAYIRNRRNGPWADVRITRLRRAISKRRHAAGQKKLKAKRPLSKKNKYFRKLKN